MLQSIYTHAGCDEIGHPVWTLFDVSIHTPTQGVTQRAMLYAIPIQVSIHTPTQGVTIDWHPLQYGCQFQSTHPRRVWLWWCVMAHHVFEFQSTHPRRVWLYIQLCLWLWIRFNPHTHAGCDVDLAIYIPGLNVSIHTPTQGVTCARWKIFQQTWMFQSTHPRRVWQRITPVVLSALYVSIHTPTQGVTSVGFTMVPTLYMFQSTHPRRVWLYI